MSYIFIPDQYVTEQNLIEALESGRYPKQAFGKLCNDRFYSCIVSSNSIESVTKVCAYCVLGVLSKEIGFRDDVIKEHSRLSDLYKMIQIDEGLISNINWPIFEGVLMGMNDANLWSFDTIARQIKKKNLTFTLPKVQFVEE